jgi:hypothetical protein
MEIVRLISFGLSYRVLTKSVLSFGGVISRQMYMFNQKMFYATFSKRIQRTPTKVYATSRIPVRI